MSRPVFRLPLHQRCAYMRRFVGHRCRLEIWPQQRADLAEGVTGVVVSVAYLDHGTTKDVVVLRPVPGSGVTDQAYSLAQVAHIESLSGGNARRVR